MSDFENFIFHFRAYNIQNEADCQAALADFQLSKELIDMIIDLKAKVLIEIVDTNQYQITQFAFELLVQSLTKNNVNLFSNIINYTAANQTII
ncbi:MULTISPECIES: hypothetical protein [Emticicia]|uniref:hypothetical protein n=1 Tax=Emticicia TaxID=312278 RepID=UPI0012E81C03|nr:MULTISPECIES: hypothetical protein [Emticicia]